MVHRSAVTLIEVLVSIFIMGVGLLALLTLFPLGALTMAQAIKDDRCAQAAANAEAIALFRDLRTHNSVINNPVGTNSFINPAAPAGLPDLRQVPRGPEGPSYPVYVDPIGRTNITPTASRPAVGALPAINSPGIPRINVRFPSVGNVVGDNLMWFSLLDEMDFTEDGVPKVYGTEIQRDPQYTWAYLLRRPQASVANVVDVSVVVYYRRPLQSSPIEPVYGPVTFDTNSNEVVVTWDSTTQSKPPLRKGSWIMDATILGANGQPSPHGFFYRVINVTDMPAAGNFQSMTLELQSRPKKGTTNGVLVIMEHVAEVFEKAGDWKP
jgi:type II secretory pathway pseudopilin PulG